MLHSGVVRLNICKGFLKTNTLAYSPAAPLNKKSFVTLTPGGGEEGEGREGREHSSP
jgi:hypothetical protein